MKLSPSCDFQLPAIQAVVAEVAVVLLGLQVVGVIRATVPVLDATKKTWDDCQVLGVMIKTDR